MGGGNGVKSRIIYTHSIFIVDFHFTDYIYNMVNIHQTLSVGSLNQNV